MQTSFIVFFITESFIMMELSQDIHVDANVVIFSSCEEESGRLRDKGELMRALYSYVRRGGDWGPFAWVKTFIT